MLDQKVNRNGLNGAEAHPNEKKNTQHQKHEEHEIGVRIIRTLRVLHSKGNLSYNSEW